MNSTASPGPLSGLRILEIGHFVAAPFAARLLGDLGADIIKIEPPTGDPVRQWGEQIDGKSLWWSVHGRNKRSVTINLKAPEAAQLIIDIAAQCDAVIENYRPGHLEKLGIGPEQLRSGRPDLIIAHISGYGQDGPDRNKPAFGVIGEAIGGLRYLTNNPPGEANTPPVRVGVSIGDSLAGMYAAFGIMSSLWARDRLGGNKSPLTLDIALTESVLSMMEGMIPEYGALGKIKQPTGGAIATAAPSNAYPTSDGEWILIAANSDPLFRKLAMLMDRADLADDPQFKGNQDRVRNVTALDRIISEWSRQLPFREIVTRLENLDIPHSKIFTAADCADDPQFRDRGMVTSVPDSNFTSVLHPGVMPRILENPGAIRWPGPDIGAHTEEVLTTLLGKTSDEIQALRVRNVL